MINKVNVKIILTLGIVLSILFPACDPCTDCGPDNTYPYFKLSVLNRTSLDTLSLDVIRLKEEIVEIDTLIKNEESDAEKELLNNLKTIKTDSLNYYNNLVNIVENRKISIETINGVEDLFYSETTKSDSLSLFRVPISTKMENATYVIKFEETSFQNNLAISYTLKDTIINDKITESAINLEVMFHDFDSLRGPSACEIQPCISNEQTIYVEI